MLWVLIRSASNDYPQHYSWWGPIAYFHGKIRKKNKQTNKQKKTKKKNKKKNRAMISTWKKTNVRINTYFTSRVLVDDQLVLQNRWSTMIFTPILSTNEKCHERPESSRKHTYIILTPLNTTFIAKLGFTGVYFIFLIFAQKHRLWVLVRTF